MNQATNGHRTGSKWRARGLLLVALTVLAGCKRAPASPPAGAVLLRVGERVVTSSDLEADIQRLRPEARALYATPEARVKYVRQLIEQDILLTAAEKQGYESDPAVVEAKERAMVLKLLRERLGTGPAPGEITEADARRYYDEHPSEFGPPALTRVRAVLFAKREAAAALQAEAERALTSRPPAERLALFETLVERASGGAVRRELSVSERYEPAGQPKAVFDAAWALSETGQVSGVVETSDGYYVLALEERSPRSIKPFEEVKQRILRTLSDQARDRKVHELARELGESLLAEVFPDRFASVRFEPARPDARTSAAEVGERRAP